MIIIQNVSLIEETPQLMHEMVNEYYRDLFPCFTKSIPEMFEIVRKIPYQLEDGEFQLLSRPRRTLLGTSPYIACANKSIVLGSYFKLHKIPFCFVIVGYDEIEDYSHVFPEIQLNGKHLPIDATYSRYRLTLSPEPYRYAKRVYNGESN